MADQSLLSRIGASVLPTMAGRVFPDEWLSAGDDRSRLAAVAKKRRRNDGPRPDLLLGRKWGRATTDVEGRELHLFTPKGGSRDKVLFYCHGGAFVVGPSAVEWLAAARLADALGCDLALFDYPKVPEHDAADILDTTLAAYHLIAERYGDDQILIGGTSAGGGLAVSTMLQLHRSAASLPVAAVLISPWLDMTVSHPEVGAFEDSDKLLKLDVLRRDGELYAGDKDTKDPRVSPRFMSNDELAALPPLIVGAGELETLRPEAEELVGRVNAHGGTASLHLEAFGQHAGMIVGTREGSALFDDVVAATLQAIRVAA